MKGARAGLILMVAAALCFSGMVAMVKIARVDLSAVEVVVWRGLVAVPIAALMAWRGGFRVKRKGLVLLRVLLGFAAMLAYFTAARGLSLADLTLIFQLQPILIALCAPLILGRGERPGPRTWGVLVAGLIGCAVLLGPELQVGNLYGLWALACAVLSTASHLTLRALGPTEKPAAVVFWFQLGATPMALGLWLLSSAEPIDMPPTPLWPILLAVGLFATLGQFFLTRAYQASRAAEVAAAGNVGPLFAALLDLLLFDRWPGPSTLVGGALVMGSIAWLMMGPRAGTEGESG